MPEINTGLRDQLIKIGFKDHPRCPKQGHKSRGAAEAQMRGIQRSAERQPDRKDPETLEVYKCQKYVCREKPWHVGHASKGEI